MNMLSAVGWLYGLGTDARNAFYDRGYFQSESLGAKTISIGNITAGGTGKTPLVALTANILADTGEKVCILTRGYGRENAGDRVIVSDGKSVLVDARTGGDEPVELARKLLGKAFIIADADRVSAAKWACEQFGITAFVLDDGFQHRRVERDLDIVCIDATNPFGNREMLPAGILREPLCNLGRADAIVITRADLVESIDDLRSEIADLAFGRPVFVSENRITKCRKLEEFYTDSKSPESDRIEVDWAQLRTEGVPDNVDEEVRVAAFCALGNPDSFFVQMVAAFDDEHMNDEFDLTIMKSFPDHHFYTQADIDALEKQATQCRVDAFVTTAKDAVKLEGLKLKLPCYVVEIEPAMDSDSGFVDLVSSAHMMS